MNDFILFLHFVGLIIGAGGGLASSVLMRKAQSMPDEQAATIRRLGPLFANVTAIGVALLWITGLILVWSEWNGFANLPGLFWVKFVFILTLTVAIGLILWTYAEVRRGNTAATARLPFLGPAAGLSALFAVLFAAYAFG